MARMTSLEVLEQKIEKAQDKVSRSKKQYETAVAELSELLDKRDAIRNDNLLKAFAKSEKTYEEALEFFGVGSEET